MGIPYSKQIHTAFDEVTPLVAAGFQVLRTSRNISILLAVLQLATGLISALTLLALLAILVAVNPDLEPERRALVTPAARWLAAWAMDARWLRVAVWTVLFGAGLGSYAGWCLTRDVTIAVEKEEEDKKEGERIGDEVDAHGKGKEKA